MYVYIVCDEKDSGLLVIIIHSERNQDKLLKFVHLFQNKGCESSCHFYDVLKTESVVPSPLWEFSESALCDSNDPNKIELSWATPHPATGEDMSDTYLLYVLFVINDDKPEWTKLAMVSIGITVHF